MRLVPDQNQEMDPPVNMADVRAEIRDVKTAVGILHADLRTQTKETREILRTITNGVSVIQQRVNAVEIQLRDILQSQVDRDALLARDLGSHSAALARVTRGQTIVATATDIAAIVVLGALAYTGVLPGSVAGTAVLAVIAGRLTPRGHGGALLSLLPISSRRSDPPSNPPGNKLCDIWRSAACLCPARVRQLTHKQYCAQLLTRRL